MKKIITQYGLYSGLAAAALMIATGFLLKDGGNWKNSELLGYVGILLSMLFVFLGVKAYRDKENGGSVSFGKAFQVGLFITLISCVCYVISWIFVYKTMMPDFMDRYMEYAMGQLRESGATEEILSKKTAEMEKFKEMYKNPLIMVAMTFMEPFPVGLVVSLIAAAVLRKR